MEEELLLVDDNDVFTGNYAPKSDCHRGSGLHHRAFTLLIYNSRGEILLQERKHELWDKFLDLTNSHPLRVFSGPTQSDSYETYDEALERCLLREWRVAFPVKKLFGFNYFASYGDDLCENEYCAFFIGKFDGQVFPNLEVLYGYKWMPFEHFIADVKLHPESYTPWLIKAMEEFVARGSWSMFGGEVR
jgi:isopentenyl-diphosphate delta-isomerase